MISAFTHLAATPERTHCGLTIPPITSAIQPTRGSRVGIIVGDHCHTAYVVGAEDTNRPCMACLEASAASPLRSLPVLQFLEGIFTSTQPIQQ